MSIVLRRLFAKTLLAGMNAFLYVRYFRLVGLFVKAIGYWPNLAIPYTFNEKTNWRKIFDKDPRFPELQDKLAAREFVKSRCPEINLLDIIWVGSDPGEIPFEKIDRPVVIKANHGCGYNYFVPDPEKLDRLDILLFATRVISDRWGREMYEWAYQSIEPKIYIEEMLIGATGTPEATYKAHVYGGVARLSLIVAQPVSGMQRSYFDEFGDQVDGQRADYNHPSSIVRLPIHDIIDQQAALLCCDFDALRADFFVHDSKIYFNEFTIYPGSGLTAYVPREFDSERGKHWDITKSHYFTSGSSRFRRIYRACLRALQPPVSDMPIVSGRQD